MIEQGLQIWCLMPAVATQKLRLVLLQQWWIYVQRCSDLGVCRPRMGSDLPTDLPKCKAHFFRSFGTRPSNADQPRVDEEKSAHE